MKLTHILVFAAVIFLASCGTPKNVVYFQDTVDNTMTQLAKQEDIRLRPGDKIFVLVNSRDPNLVNMFNLPYVSRQIGTNYTNAQNQGIAGYTIDKNGCINFPVLGLIHVSGLTREEIARKIEKELIDRKLANDAVVTVEFQNLSVSVMGEVKNPGKYTIDRDNVTILDAISMAGDLTVYGHRNNVKVTRREGEEQHTYVVDLTSAESTYGSPVFYLQQNDVVYVEPNDTKIRQSTVNGNNLRSTSFWISLASLLTSVSLLFVK